MDGAWTDTDAARKRTGTDAARKRTVQDLISIAWPEITGSCPLASIGQLRRQAGGESAGGYDGRALYIEDGHEE